MKLNQIVAMTVVAAVVAGCGPKKTQEEVMQEWRQRAADTEAFFERTDITVEQADSAIAGMIDFSLQLAEEYPSPELSQAVLDDLFWYLTTEQKEALYAHVDTAVFDEKQARYFRSYKAELATRVGGQYVDFGALTPAGDSLYLHDVVGQKQYTLVDFWATWCGPCRMSMPALKALYAEASDRLDIVGVSLDRDGERWRAFIPENELTWYHMSDLRQWECEAAALYGASAIPATVLIDENGVIVARNAEPDELREIIMGE